MSREQRSHHFRIIHYSSSVTPRVVIQNFWTKTLAQREKVEKKQPSAIELEGLKFATGWSIGITEPNNFRRFIWCVHAIAEEVRDALLHIPGVKMFVMSRSNENDDLRFQILLFPPWFHCKNEVTIYAGFRLDLLSIFQTAALWP